jgi:hypothetical protein
MPSQLELNSLALCNRIFRPFLWKYIAFYDTNTSTIALVTDKAAIRRWIFFDSLFLFCGCFIFPLLIGLTKILHPSLLPNYRLIDAVATAIIILSGGCLVIIELGVFFFRFEASAAFRHLLQEERKINFNARKF